MDFNGFFDQVRGPAGRVFRGLYGAPNDPRLTNEQNQAALGSGLTQGGLAMMLAGGQPNQNFLSVLAQGMLASQQGVQQFQQNQLAVQNQMQMAEMAQGPPTPGNLGKMMMAAIGSGNIEAARTISEVLKSMMAAQGNLGRRRTAREVLETEPGSGEFHKFIIDSDTGERLADLGPDKPRLPTAQLRQVMGADGLPRYEWMTVDEQGNPQNIAAGRDPWQNSTEAMTRAYPFQNLLTDKRDPDGNVIRQGSISALDLMGAPNRAEYWIGMRGWNELLPEDKQALFIHGTAVAEAWLRMTTGAAYTATELENAYRMFIPRPGDSAGTLATKMRNRQALLEAVNDIATGRSRRVTIAGRTYTAEEIDKNLFEAETEPTDDVRADDIQAWMQGDTLPDPDEWREGRNPG